MSLQNAIAKTPKSVPLLIEIAKIYDELQNPGKTIEWCSKALKVIPDIALAYVFLGSAYMRLPDTNKAVNFLLRALTLDPGSEYAYEIFGALILHPLLCIGTPVQLLQEYSMVGFSLPNGPTVSIKDFRQGIEFYQKGCTEKGEYLRVHYRMGMLYYYANKPDALYARIKSSADSGYEPAKEWLIEIDKANRQQNAPS